MHYEGKKSFIHYSTMKLVWQIHICIAMTPRKQIHIREFDPVSEPKKLLPDPATDPTFQIIPDLDPAPDPFSDPGQYQIF